MTAAPTDLSTLANLKAYLVNPGTNADGLLQRLLSSASMMIEQFLNRDIVVMSYTKTFDGNNGTVLMMPDYPLVSVSSVTIDGQVIPSGGGYTASGGATAGYFFTYKQVTLIGYRFCQGKNNVVVTYTAGFQITGEAATIPATPYQVTAKQPRGTWLSDQGVTYNGTPLTAVASNPTTGQYSVSSAGLYTFAAADVGHNVLINYGYAPFDIEQACLSLVQYWLTQRTNNGEASRSMGGQTITFVQKDMPAWVKTTLLQYQRTFTA